MSDKKPTILIVDDELDALEGHIASLTDAGVNVSTLRSTDEALREILSGDIQAFDLVVLDMMIPPPVENPEPIDVWDGLRSGGHLLAILRRESKKFIPALLLSNLAEEEVELEAWDRFQEWAADNGASVPAARTSDEVRDVLCRHFRVWIRGKRRTPPWHFATLCHTILAESKSPVATG